MFGLAAIALATRGAEPADFSELVPILGKHCVECHSGKEADGSLLLDSFGDLLKGGESGPAIVPGKSSESLLIRTLEGTAEKKGKKIVMPPGKKDKLSAAQVALFKSWIDAGAKPPLKPVALELETPKVPVRVQIKPSVFSLAYAPGPNLIAAGRHGRVELIDGESRSSKRMLDGHRGDVGALVFNADGSTLFAASGRPSQWGEVRAWKTSDGQLLGVYEGHRDALYSLALNPAGSVLASGGYDHKVTLWDTATRKPLHTLSVHNGGIFDLAFRADGAILASASLDRTVKLWDPKSGQRRDTLSQSLKEVHAVVFSKDGKRLWTGGADNRIRVYEISESAAETTNPLIEARYAHEGAVLKLALSQDGTRLASAADDRTVKIWDSANLKETATIERQPDWPSGVAFIKNGALAVSRLDGSIGYYDAASGKASAASGKPELLRLESRGLQVGQNGRGKLIGKNLGAIVDVRSSSPQVKVRVIPDVPRGDSELTVEWSAEAGASPGSVEIWATGEGVETGRKALYLDDLPQNFESAGGGTARMPLDSSYWGRWDAAGDTDEIEFDTKAGQSMVADLRCASVGGKGMPSISVLDPKGRVIAESRGGDGVEPLLGFETTLNGRHRLVIRERTAAGSPEHDYRLTLTTRAFVTGVFPLAASRTKAQEVQLAGFHLRKTHRVKLEPSESNETELKLDPAQYRFRRSVKVPRTDFIERTEQEPNNTMETAQLLSPGEAVSGHFSSAADLDVFLFDAAEGESFVVETLAAHYDSPADTRIEVAWPDGRLVDRVRLQAVRNTAINFRPIDSNSGGARLDHYEEMELNQLLYLRGEVVRLFRMPQGPDSEMAFYSRNGKRKGYFDTSAVAHALEEVGYIVEPHPPGTPPSANGLPSFTIPYANDDDAERKAGVDSKLIFQAPKSGRYAVRVRENRSAFGERHAYRLVVRPPKPDFELTLNSDNLNVPRGSGQSFTYTAGRRDGFEGEIRIELEGMPEGMQVSSPIVVQEGHTTASGVVFVSSDAQLLAGTNVYRLTARATAILGGNRVEKQVPAPVRIEIKPEPKLTVRLDPAEKSASSGSTGSQPEMLTIRPGQTVRAMLRVARSGHEDLITFNLENLPHGVIVDNIGLNGVLMPKGENEREIFINAARWVPKQERLCYAVENQAGRQTSRPVLLRVEAD